MINFYHEHGISQISSSSNDIIKINGKTVATRFLEMSILNVYRIFNERFPEAVARSTFNTPRPKEMRIATSHDTCMRIIHENIIRPVIEGLHQLFISSSLS